MDSVTQATLGTAVGHAADPAKGRRRGAIVGAVLGTLPDLDVLIPMANDVLDMTAHRSATHSLPVHIVATPVIVLLLSRVWPEVRNAPWRWTALVFLCLSTHALIDAVTVDGTQLLWPISSHPEGWSHPVSWSTLFIIDPLYTLPLLAGVVAVLWRPGTRASWWNRAGLCLSSLYILFSIAAKDHAESAAHEHLEAHGLPSERLISMAAPFNTLLWRVLVMEDDGDYLEGFRSLLDGDAPMHFQRYPGGAELAEPLLERRTDGRIDSTWSLRRMAWFTGGFYALQERGDELHLIDLRMGMEPTYFFRFAVARRQADSTWTPMIGERREPAPDGRQLGWVWRRIRDPDAR